MEHFVGDHFNPRPPRGGRPEIFNADYGFTDISIHAPREGGDYLILWIRRWWTIFQSTPPARGATDNIGHVGVVGLISIHAPREGGDYG